jgi:hypothetical protein
MTGLEVIFLEIDAPFDTSLFAKFQIICSLHFSGITISMVKNGLKCFSITQNAIFHVFLSIILNYLLHIFLFYVPQLIFLRNSNFTFLDLSGAPLIIAIIKYLSVLHSVTVILPVKIRYNRYKNTFNHITYNTLCILILHC